MARLPLLTRLLRQPHGAAYEPGVADEPGVANEPGAANEPGVAEDPGAAVTPATAPPPRRRRSVPPAGALRRERRALLRVREQRLRDLGGLALEMYRRDRFREDLLLERCAELIGLEARVHELDAFLGRASAPPQAKQSARCACGAPLLWGSHYCANCGRPVVAKAAPAATGGDE